MKPAIHEAVSGAIEAISTLKESSAVSFIESVTRVILSTYEEKGKLLIAGNGGSLCDAMHFAEELSGYFREKRPALSAIALCDPGHMSCVANDVGFKYVFARGVEALGTKGDLLVLLSTSGNSDNLIEAAKIARKLGIKVIGFLGKDGGDLKDLCDLYWVVEGFKYSDRIQEAHMAAIHIIIELVEKALFYGFDTDSISSKTQKVCY